MSELRLRGLGAVFAGIMGDYRAAQSQLSALQHAADRTAADAGLVYGSSAWSEHRFAVTGRTVRHVNELYVRIEDLAEEIISLDTVSVSGLLIKARAYDFAGNPGAIIREIEALATADPREAA